LIFLDFRPGITLPLLLKSSTLTCEDGVKTLKAQAAALFTGAGGRSPLTDRLAAALKLSSVDEIILALKDSCAALPPVSVGEAAAWAAPGQGAVALAPYDGKEAARLMEESGLDFLDPFEFSAYILLTILTGCHEQTLKILIPRIGSDSSERVFSILTTVGLRIDPAAPVVSSWGAAILARHFSPFARETPSTGFERLLDMEDPLNPACSARAFFFRESVPAAETVTVIQANIDDMTPEILAQAVRVMFHNGALDVTIIPALMKKGRPGFQVEVIARPDDRTKMEELVLRETSTFGVRSFSCSRTVLERRVVDFNSTFGRIRVKRGYWRGTCLRSVPEYEDVAALSEKIGIPLLRLYTDIQNEIARDHDIKSGRSGKESV
jgi:hypothetical protein